MADGVDGAVELPDGRGPADGSSGVDRAERLGLADRFDELWLRLEVWREQPGVAGALIIVAALMAAGAWWLAQPPDGVPVELTIPLASAADGHTAEPSVDQNQPSGPDGLAGVGPDGRPVGVGGEVGTVGEVGAIPASASGGTSTDRPATGDHDDTAAGHTIAGHTVDGYAVDGGPGGRAEPQIVVHIVGAVRTPGIVRLDPGSRVDDALRAAGGPAEDADVEQLNLAAPIADGSQVRVPAQNQTVDGPLIVAPPPTTTQPGSMSQTASPETTEQPGPLNLNTATEVELQELPGVGPTTAAAIVDWREENGGFLSIDDLTDVPGIGPVKLSRVRDRVTI